MIQRRPGSDTFSSVEGQESEDMSLSEDEIRRMMFKLLRSKGMDKLPGYLGKREDIKHQMQGTQAEEWDVPPDLFQAIHRRYQQLQRGK